MMSKIKYIFGVFLILQQSCLLLSSNKLISQSQRSLSDTHATDETVIGDDSLDNALNLHRKERGIDNPVVFRVHSGCMFELHLEEMFGWTNNNNDNNNGDASDNKNLLHGLKDDQETKRTRRRSDNDVRSARIDEKSNATLAQNNKTHESKNNNISTINNKSIDAISPESKPANGNWNNENHENDSKTNDNDNSGIIKLLKDKQVDESNGTTTSSPTTNYSIIDNYYINTTTDSVATITNSNTTFSTKVFNVPSITPASNNYGDIYSFQQKTTTSNDSTKSQKDYSNKNVSTMATTAMPFTTNATNNINNGDTNVNSTNGETNIFTNISNKSDKYKNNNKNTNDNGNSTNKNTNKNNKSNPKNNNSGMKIKNNNATGDRYNSANTSGNNNIINSSYYINSTNSITTNTKIMSKNTLSTSYMINTTNRNTNKTKKNNNNNNVNSDIYNSYSITISTTSITTIVTTTSSKNRINKSSTATIGNNSGNSSNVTFSGNNSINISSSSTIIGKNRSNSNKFTTTDINLNKTIKGSSSKNSYSNYNKKKDNHRRTIHHYDNKYCQFSQRLSRKSWMKYGRSKHIIVGFPRKENEGIFSFPFPSCKPRNIVIVVNEPPQHSLYTVTFLLRSHTSESINFRLSFVHLISSFLSHSLAATIKPEHIHISHLSHAAISWSVVREDERKCSFGKKLSQLLTSSKDKPSFELSDTFNRFLAIYKVNISFTSLCERVEISYGVLDKVAIQWIQWFLEVFAVIVVPIGCSLALHRWYRRSEPSKRDIPTDYLMYPPNEERSNSKTRRSDRSDSNDTESSETTSLTYECTHRNEQVRTWDGIRPNHQPLMNNYHPSLMSKYVTSNDNITLRDHMGTQSRMATYQHNALVPYDDKVEKALSLKGFTTWHNFPETQVHRYSKGVLPDNVTSTLALIKYHVESALELPYIPVMNQK